MGSFLDKLGLPPPTDLRLPAGYDPDDPKKRAGPPKAADPKLPADPRKQVELLADAIAKTDDAVKRDQLVRALRDVLAKIVPLMSNAEAKKQIDKLIEKGIDAGAKAALLKLIEAAVGQPAQTMPDDDHRTQYGPNIKEKDLKEHILSTPPIPFGKPPAVHRNRFEFRGLPTTAKPGVYVKFKLVTPDWFDPNKTPGSWVMVMSTADYAQKKLGGNDTDVHIDQKGTLDRSIRMPDEPGSYVIVIKIQSGFEGDPEPIELK
jgi:hypothetical protein